MKTLKALAEELSMDRSACRRWVIKQGITMKERVCSEGRFQSMLVLEDTEYATLVSLRRSYGSPVVSDRKISDHGARVMSKLLEHSGGIPNKYFEEEKVREDKKREDHARMVKGKREMAERTAMRSYSDELKGLTQIRK